jgi:hypothetical protein
MGNSDTIQKKTTFWEVEIVLGVFEFLSAFKRFLMRAPQAASNRIWV